MEGVNQGLLDSSDQRNIPIAVAEEGVLAFLAKRTHKPFLPTGHHRCHRTNYLREILLL